MNGTELFTKMTELDNDLIEEAMKPTPKKRKFNLVSYQVLAACLTFLLLGSAAAKLLFLQNSNKPATQHLAASPNVTESSEGLFIPKIEFPSPEQNATADMLSLITYKGNVYIQTGQYEGKEAKDRKHLLEKHLGTTRCVIDEYSKQDVYATDLASTTPCGEAYTVKGYDPSFLLCALQTFTEDGKEITYLSFFENLNGIYLKTGADLFEKRLHLISNWSSVVYQTSSDLKNEVEGFRPLNTVTDGQLRNFLTALSSAKFISMGNTLDYTKQIGTLLFTLKDDTQVSLYLYEGGYVEYGALHGYCVKLPDKVFQPLYKACKPSN